MDRKELSKRELVARVADLAGVTKKEAGNVLEATLVTITEAVANGQKVSLAGFGAFEPRQRKGRTGKNPRTGEILNIAAKVVPAFKAFKGFQSKVERLRGS